MADFMIFVMNGLCDSSSGTREQQSFRPRFFLMCLISSLRLIALISTSFIEFLESALDRSYFISLTLTYSSTMFGSWKKRIFGLRCFIGVNLRAPFLLLSLLELSSIRTSPSSSLSGDLLRFFFKVELRKVQFIVLIPLLWKPMLC